MKKFQGVESKFSNVISNREPANLNQPPQNDYRSADLPPKPMNKA